MLRITIPATEYFNEETNEFISGGDAIEVRLEHSLVSISKWESKWEKAFLGKKEKTDEELLDYIRCMTITPDVPKDAYLRLTPALYKEIEDYINAPMTAIKFPKDNKSSQGMKDVVTSDLIYYWMIAYNIPVEFQRWHLNRLLALIRVCNMKNSPPKKSNPKDVLRRHAAINKANRRRYKSRG